MDYKELNIKSCYESGIDDIIQDFYIPVLDTSCAYDRIAGFFSSSALAVVARGLSGFISNKGHMRLICSPILNQDDANAIQQIADSDEIPSQYIEMDLDNIESEFEKDHVKALGWMLANGLLEMKLAVVCNIDKRGKNIKGLFHQKVGIIRDCAGNALSFSGSINETASAWVNNDEEFKVFNSWSDSVSYLNSDIQKFDEIWNAQRDNIKVFNLPSAVKQNLISFSKDFDAERISLDKYLTVKKQNRGKGDISLFYYQKEALEKWKSNNYQLLIEMATGTGKTRTAIACMKHLLDRQDNLIVIVSCPQNTLSKQWKEEVEKFHFDFAESKIIDGTNKNWLSDLGIIIQKNKIGVSKHCIIYTTHATASSDNFIDKILKSKGKNAKFLFIGDECHWLGASKNRKALLDCYEYRVGLSATPSRWFDDSGTQILKNYFGNLNFEFTIKQALLEFNPLTNKHFLVQYHYYIRNISLTDDESFEYKKLTAQLVKLSGQKEKDISIEEKYQLLLEKRANIIKNADAKYDEFRTILEELISNNGLKNVIIFVSPQQIDNVKLILTNYNIRFHKLTESEGTFPEKQYGGISEREFIIKNFKNGKYQALIAIKCLDEGIDIPSASTGILLSSSTNPREYVQRIGRIIRQDDGKEFSNLYDICVNSITGLDVDEKKLETNIRSKEQIRLKEIAENAINYADALEHILQLN
ncbi:MAG: DEAD/DEAH box helicase family protein [Paludibacteraceae bacterium]|nr:DEAD/DEAH box helicase family protein [Paludibacteraceae bacterium]